MNRTEPDEPSRADASGCLHPCRSGQNVPANCSPLGLFLTAIHAQSHPSPQSRSSAHKMLPPQALHSSSPPVSSRPPSPPSLLCPIHPSIPHIYPKPDPLIPLSLGNLQSLRYREQASPSPNTPQLLWLPVPQCRINGRHPG